ncbi:MAG: exo-beta-N-acetylmuramidase NamZ domain-containing protein, partial [Planctomycetota bacterium]
MLDNKSRKMRLSKVSTILILVVLVSGCEASVKTGLDNINSYRHLFDGKRVGIITNHTAYNSSGKYIVDVFRSMNNVTITAFFSPEHGIYGVEEDGRRIESMTEPNYQIPVYSLYGKTLKPTRQMLENIDVLVFDIQDIGARFYTYIYTMSLAMEAAAEYDKRFVVLDRPNPINGLRVEGNILKLKFATFVGLYPIPVRH